MRFLDHHFSSHTLNRCRAALLVTLAFIATTASFAATRKTTNRVTSGEAKQAAARLSEMGYGSGRNALVAFQKYEGRKANGQLTRADFEAIMNASAPEARDAGYRHVEVDL